MTPDLNTLSELVALVSRWEQDGNPLDDLLTDALPVLRQGHPTIEAVHFSRHSSTHSSEDAADGLHFDLHDDQGQPYGRLTITGAKAGSGWLDVAGAYLKTAVSRYIADDLIQRQAVISGQLSACDSFTDIAGVLGRELLTSGEYIVVNLLQRDAGGQLSALQTVASANRHRAYRLNNTIPITLEQIGSTMRRVVEAGETVMIPDVQGDPEIDERIKWWTKDRPITSALIFPLKIRGEIVGLMNFNGVGHVLHKTRREVQLMQALADQVAAFIESRNVLQERDFSLEEIRLLYSVSRDLLAAEDTISVLKAIWRNLAAADADSVTLTTYGWDDLQETITSIVTEAAIDQDGAHPQPQVGVNPLDAETINLLTAELKNGVNLIEDYAPLLESHPWLRASYEAGVRSSVILPIYEDNRLIQQVNINYHQPRTFDERIQRLYTATRDQLAIVLQNQRLIRDMRQTAASLGSQVRVLQTINHLAADLTNTQDEQVLIDRTCEALVNALQIDHASIALFGRNTQEAAFTSEYPEEAGGILPLLDHAVQEELRLHQQPIIIQDIMDDGRLPQDIRSHLQSRQVQSLMLLPLTDRRAGLIGLIELDIFERGRRFHNEVVDIARTITAQIGVALQNIRLLHNTQHQTHQMEGIVSFGQAVQTTFDLPTLLEVTLINMTTIFEFHHVAVLLYRPTRQALQVVATQDAEGTIQVDLEGVVAVDLTGTTVERAWETQNPLIINDLHQEANLKPLFQEDVRSVMTLLIYAHGGTVGIIEIASLKPTAYNNVDAAVFQQLVSQLSAVIENAEAYMQSQRLARSKALVNDISSRLQGQMEIDQLLNVTMQELGRALGAKRGRIRLNAQVAQQEQQTEPDNV